MPILGADLPSKLIEDTRNALVEGINNSQVIKTLLGEAEPLLKRLPYKGDYLLQGHSPKTGFFPIAKFGILPMPGCKGICIFHHVEVELEWRGKKLGRELLKIRQEAAKIAGYTLAIATVKQVNKIEHNLLISEDWRIVSSFRNRRTNNDVLILEKQL